jgi:two-component system NtrC family sensor kinase
MPLRGPDGEIAGVLGTYMDISDRKRIEEELRLRNSFIEKLLENSPIGFAVNAIDGGQAVYVSRNFETIYGVRPGSIRSADDYFEQVFIDPPYREAMRERMMTDIQSGDPGRMRWEDLVVPTCSGETRVVTAINIPLFDQNLMISTVMDVTEQRNMQIQLLHAQKLESIGQLAAGIAHEINTPTQYVSDNARFLKDAWVGLSRLIEDVVGITKSLPDSEAGRLAAQDILLACQKADLEFLAEQVPLAIDQSIDGLSRIASIVSAMKEFSHPDCGDASMADLNAAIKSTTGVSRSEWKYVADLKLDLDPDLPPVPCNVGEINQVMLNLIVNAAHAIGASADGSKGKGVITIATRRTDDGMVRITVADTGVGIPESVQQRVFDPFFTTKEVGKGTGQGLAIAHNVVTKHHGGKIDFTSQPGVGTTFTILLPIERGATEAA